MRRSALRSRPKPSTTDRTAALAWRTAVLKGAACVVCGTRRNLDAHHLISQQVLKREFPRGAVWDGPRLRPVSRFEQHDVSLQKLLWTVANGIAVCRDDHFRHESAFARLQQKHIPTRAFIFARVVGLADRLGPRYYP